ncbi:hypothetical protein SERLA73DRAFT_72446 [Serpula lacrymans var. lacrymans S7.3]|uniref:Uncharacterized protein n=2 Tax=Serpula lacrymans var. lacrymans TaxID=341189 RepID=F8PUC8_SERL3|nr:uncharacterized protein SERLADRAFT_436970 [Serpula lacrymans var. lacrymans S7.9]EGN99648.1 hypothetical protein SERLA73DRAFT_72446 [Serpula lacrymans var. lacrymans S7.3]EGO25211.1 hypothetical protein SERLADRAFT_436970 [Serpula lacrymans var. lacrymans S7.9]
MTLNHAHESLFGPPSEPIDVSKFLQDAGSRFGPGGSSSAISTLNARWENLTQEKMDAVQAECLGSIAELKSSAEDAWNNPIVSAHLIKNHETAVGAIYDQADTSKSSRTTASNRGGRKRKRQDEEGLADRPEVKSLQEKLDAIQLNCWSLPPGSALFIRPSKNGDQNALTTAKRMGRGVLSLNQTPIPHSSDTRTSISTDTSYPSSGQALITISVHNRIPWSHNSFSRVSQHVVISTQSLADLVEVIPCISNEIPDENLDDEGHAIGYELGQGARGQSDRMGFVFCIEGIIYDETDEGVNAEKTPAGAATTGDEERQVASGHSI